MKTGDVVCWCVIDAENGQVLALFNSRASARGVAGNDKALRIAKVTVSK